LQRSCGKGSKYTSVAFGFGGEGALLVYPRKSLQKQQPELLLKILHHMNKYLKDELGIELTVAIDKGVAEEQDYERERDCRD